MFNLFKKKSKHVSVHPLTTDIHSHLLPGIDDGVQTLAESLEILEQMQQMGYRKVITTPHIMKEFYPNTPQIIREKLQIVRQGIRERGLDIQLDAAAEYYLDDHFMKLLKKPEELLTINEHYLLFETPFMNKPAFLFQAIFELKSLGLQPVMAHPERYIYLHQNNNLIEKLIEKGVYFQVNLNALAGRYSRESKKLAEKLIEHQVVQFAGSDCHHMEHIEAMKKAVRTKLFKQLSASVKNNEL